MFTITLEDGRSFEAWRIEFDHYENMAHIDLDMYGENKINIPVGSIESIEW